MGRPRDAAQTGMAALERRPEGRKAIRRADARTLPGRMREAREASRRAEAEAIRAATLLLQGARTEPVFAALAGATPGARVELIADATHGLPREQPAAVNAAVLGFLAGLRATAD